MRCVGYIESESQARVFRSYLLTLGIHADLEQARDKRWGVWVHEENRLDEGAAELQAFVADPKNERFSRGAAAGQEIDRARAKDERKYKDRHVDMRTAWHKNQSGGAPLTYTLIFISVAVTLMQHFPGMGDFFERWLYAAALYRNEAGLGFYHRDPFHDILHGQVWRLITPVFIHAKFLAGFGIMHILFNMMWLNDLGGRIERVEGTARLGIMALVFALLSNVLEQWMVGPMFGGMSGVVYGLFAYVWLLGYYNYSENYVMDRGIMVMMLVWFVLCWTGLLGPIANWAHLGGLVAGAVAATLRLRRVPFTRVRF